MSTQDNVFKVLETIDSIELSFSSTMGNIDAVCGRITDYIKAKVPDVKSYLFAINLVLREGLTNAVRHGNKGDPAKMVTLLMTVPADTCIKLMIEDQGDGFDWRKIKQSNLSGNQDHGRGIRIIESYASRYWYNDKGNILYLEKDISSKI